jgi:anti-sigma factor RsiW
MTAEHEKYLELLPWYVNGTLSDGERAELSAHLKQCLSCNAALKQERHLIGLARQHDHLGVERRHGMNALLERIDTGSARRASLSAPRALLGYGLAAVFGALIVWGVVSLGGRQAAGIADEPFSTLSDGGVAAANRIDVIFVETPDAPALDRLLSDVGGTVVGGPTGLGRYTIEVTPVSDRGIQDLIDELRQDPSVRFAGRSFAGPDSEGEAQ